MSNDVSRVYQFLAKNEDWKAKADRNGDGTVIKSEFRTFMEENFEWNGEDTSAKNDLINSFWKSIDTNKSGNVKGTKLKNLNALDSNEIDKMGQKIQVYEELNTYLESVSAPNEVNNKAQWKKSVSESLRNYTETFIQKGGKAENLAAYLDEVRTQVENKTTADLCAQEYIAQAMEDVVKEYGYAYGTDTTLNEIISSYVKNLPEGETPTSIQQNVQIIVDAYMATAGLGDGDTGMLKDYGYDTSANISLNGLQRSIAEKNLKDAMKSLEQEADYEANKDLYDKAITDFITNTLDNAKYKDFEAITKYDVTNFKNDKIGKNLAQAVQVRNLFTSEELNNAIKTQIGDSIADRITKDGKYLNVMKEITATTLEKAQNGEFNSTNGDLDTQKVLDFILKQIQSRIAEFYSNGMSDLSTNELNNVYDSMVKAAYNEADNDKALKMHRDAALQYCNALAKKSDRFKDAVKEVFGDNYSSAINKMYPSEIEVKITELRNIVNTYGDPSTFTVENWVGLPADGSALQAGTTKQYSISATINTNGAVQPNVTYSVVSAVGCTATYNNGALNITAGTGIGNAMTVKIAVMADGVKVDTKTITLKCERPKSQLIDSIGKDAWGGNSQYLEVYGVAGVEDGKVQVTSQNFSDLYNNNAVIMLHRSSGDRLERDLVRSRLTNLCDYIVNALTSTGLDNAKLKSCATSVINTLMGNYGESNKQSNTNTEKTALGTKASKMFQSGELSGVTQYVDYSGINYQVNMVSFKEVVDLILEAYGM